MLAALGASGNALRIPDTSLSQAELNQRCLFGATAGAGDETIATRDSPAASGRGFRIIERP